MAYDFGLDRMVVSSGQALGFASYHRAPVFLDPGPAPKISAGLFSCGEISAHRSGPDHIAVFRFIPDARDQGKDIIVGGVQAARIAFVDF